MNEPVPKLTPQAFSPDTLLGLLIPVLALAAFTGFLATLAVLFGWLPSEMILIAAIAGGVMLLSILAIAYLRTKARNAVRGALTNARMRLGSILETAMDGIVAIDESQKIVLFNAAAEKIFGWTRAQVLDQPLEMLLPGRFRHDHAHHVRRFGETGVTNRRMGTQTVLVGLRSNGEEFPLEASISQQVEGDRKIYTAILRDVTARVAAEQALKHSRQELRELAAVSQSAREQEKSRVARELHDEIGGALTALKMDTAWLKDRLPEANPALTEKILGMQKIIDNTVAATRRMSSDLRPMMLDDLGLVAAIEWLTQDFQKRTGIQCELAIGTDDVALSDERATAVFRILQEALTNITKHANAKSAEVNLEIDGSDMVLTVHDDGKGFDAGGPRAPRSFGLVGMRERVYLLGGAIKIESVPGDGTVIEARIPIDTAEAGS